MDVQIQSPDPPAGKSVYRYPPCDQRGRCRDALARAVASRRRAAEAEVDFAAGKGTHEDAEKFRADADEADAEVLRVKADAGNLWSFQFMAGASHPATAHSIRRILVDQMAEQMQPVWDYLNGRIDQLEAEVASYRAKEVGS